jgi:hypothetical protein
MTDGVNSASILERRGGGRHWSIRQLAAGTTLRALRRSALRERIRGQLPIQPDGSIPLLARAWAVRATI